MGRPPKDISRSGRWHDAAVMDFVARYPQGMFRPIDLESDPTLRIESMQWWEHRAALILVGCAGPLWGEARFLLWADALARAAEARSAVLEIACAAHGSGSAVDFGKLGRGFKCRRRPDKTLGLFQPRGQADDALAYFHFVRMPSELERPLPMTVSELISGTG